MTIDEKALSSAMEAYSPQTQGQPDRQRLARAIAAYLESAKQKEADGWRDMESAGRDLKAVLGYQATPGDWEGAMAICWPMGPLEGALVWIGEGGLMPTHWRPLPEPPSALLSAGGEG